jgi:predicted HTH transcriptional regulator
MDERQLRDLISLGEDSKRQFKRGFNNADALAAELIAFANAEGGVLFVGVGDDGRVSGVEPADLPRLNQLLSNAASPTCETRLWLPKLFICFPTAGWAAVFRGLSRRGRTSGSSTI